MPQQKNEPEMAGYFPQEIQNSQSEYRSGHQDLTEQRAPILVMLIDLDSFGDEESINMDAIERTASFGGRISIKKSFATAPSARIEASKSAVLNRNGQHEDCLSRDALRLSMLDFSLYALHELKVQNFIVVSGDEEVGQIAAILARRGGYVSGVGVFGLREPRKGFMQAFSEYFNYALIAKPPESEALRELRMEYAEILVAAAEQIQVRGAKPVGAALIPILRDRRPEVSLALLEMRNWRDLAEFACEEGLAFMESSGSDFMLTASDSGRDTARLIKRKDEIENAHSEETENVRTAVSGILGADLPEERIRFLVFNALQWALQEEGGQAGVSMVELSYRIAREVNSPFAPQNTIYRLMNGLYRGGAFDFEANPENEYNPIIKSVRIPVSRCDDAFVVNLMRIKNRFPVKSSPAAISTAFYGIPKKANRIESMLKIASKPAPDRLKLLAVLESIAG